MSIILYKILLFISGVIFMHYLVIATFVLTVGTYYAKTERDT